MSDTANAFRELGVDPRENPSKNNNNGVWGPTNSFESDGTSVPALLQNAAANKMMMNTNNNNNNTGAGTHTTKTSDTTNSSPKVTTTTQQQQQPSNNSSTSLTLERLYETASAAVDSLVKSARKVTSPTATAVSPNTNNNPRISSAFEIFVEETCTSPCNRNYVGDDSPPRRSMFQYNDNGESQQQQLGITPMISPAKSITIQTTNRVLSDVSTTTTDTPIITRRKKRHDYDQNNNQSNNNNNMNMKSANGGILPMATLLVADYHDITRSISELTMKSSHGEATTKLAENRRMAYYAVGKHHYHGKNNNNNNNSNSNNNNNNNNSSNSNNNMSRGGNRRCYFTGKLILGGAPFYAGSVQQGLRTLVVFCLPSAVGLPKNTDGIVRKERSDLTRRSNGSGVIPMPREYMMSSASSLKRLPTMGTMTSTSISKMSGDDMSFLEEELDPNWDLDRDYLLQVLPEPSNDLLDEMNVRYPEQFETLPVQVRSPHCWRLFIKFCFFSGLPIAEGEMHYKVMDDIAMDVYGEEIILSHEVMEAVNGEASAEILRLPNLKTFKYLRKHYTQQSGKLTDQVFQRTSWEMVRPEI